MVLQSCSSAKDYNNDLLLFNSHKSGKKAIEKIKSAINSENDDFIYYSIPINTQKKIWSERHYRLLRII